MRLILPIVLLIMFSSTVYGGNYVLLDSTVQTPEGEPGEGTSTGKWYVDAMVGNTYSGNTMFQGAARQSGQIGRTVKIAETPEGVYLYSGTEYVVDNAEVWMLQGGQVRRLMQRYGDTEGPVELCMGGVPIWSEYDEAMYFVGPGCLRKMSTDESGGRRLDVVAGTCYSYASTDGPALTTGRLHTNKGIAISPYDGAIYWLELDQLRKIHNGTISTITVSWGGDPPAEGTPYWNLGGYVYPYSDSLSWGEDSTTLYISDYLDTTNGYGILDLTLTGATTGTIDKIIGSTGTEVSDCWSGTSYSDGVLQDGAIKGCASHKGGADGRYSSVYDAIMLAGNDNIRFRWWKRGSENITTIFGTPTNSVTYPQMTLEQANGSDIPGERFYRDSTPGPRRFIGAGDDGDGLWLMYSGLPQIVFRAYNTDYCAYPCEIDSTDIAVSSSRDGRIKAAIVNTSGTIPGSTIDVSSIASGWQSEPRIAYVDGVYLAVWAELSGTDWQVMGARISSTGTVLDTTPLTISGTMTGTQTMPDVAADDTGFMVVWGGWGVVDDYPNVYAQRVETTGTFTPSPVEVIGGAAPEIAYNPTSDLFMVAFAGMINSSKINAWVLIDSDGEAQSTTETYYGIRPAGVTPTNISISANPDDGTTSQGWTFISDSQDFYRTNKGYYGAYTVTDSAVWDAEQKAESEPLNPPYSNSSATAVFNIDHSTNLSYRYPQGRSAATPDADYTIAVWRRLEVLASEYGYHMLNPDLYIGRLDKYNLVESSGVVLSADSDNGEQNPAIAGDQAGNLVVVYEKLIKEGNERQIVSRSILVDGSGITVDSTENVLVSGADMYRGYPDIAYNTTGDEYLVVWQEGADSLTTYTYQSGATSKGMSSRGITTN